MKKIPWLQLAHVLLCLLLSFDWPFLGGNYMGFALTFWILFALTFPTLIAFTTVLRVVGTAIKAGKPPRISEMIAGAAGFLILLIYLVSATGLLRHLALNFVYLFVMLATLYLCCDRLCRLFLHRAKKPPRT